MNVSSATKCHGVATAQCKTAEAELRITAETLRRTDRAGSDIKAEFHQLVRQLSGNGLSRPGGRSAIAGVYQRSACNASAAHKERAAHAAAHALFQQKQGVRSYLRKLLEREYARVACARADEQLNANLVSTALLAVSNSVKTEPDMRQGIDRITAPSAAEPALTPAVPSIELRSSVPMEPVATLSGAPRGAEELRHATQAQLQQANCSGVIRLSCREAGEKTPHQFMFLGGDRVLARWAGSGRGRLAGPARQALASCGFDLINADAPEAL